jgi:hypothetical protein
MMRSAMCLTLLAAAGCGSFGDHGGGLDAGNGNGNGDGCDMIILPFEPAEPERGDTVVAKGEVSVVGWEGIYRYEWSASNEGQRIPVESRGDDAIAIPTLRAGIYEVELRGSVGQRECFPATRTLNVREIGAEAERYRLRVVPPNEGTPAELEVSVYGGADYALGPIVLDRNASLSGQVTGPEGPLSGYVRIRGADGVSSEAFADDQGAFRAPRPPGGGPYEILVVPDDPDVAPISRSGLSEVGEIFVDAGIAVTGTVTGPDDVPVEGARVSLSVGGVPSTLVETDEGGTFTLRARPGEAIVRVSAPAARGLFDLRAADVAVAADSHLVISYAPAGDTVAAPQIMSSDDASPAPGARVIWIADPVEEAGSVDTGTELHLAIGSARREAFADEAGVMAELRLPRASYEVLVAPGDDGVAAGQAATAILVDLDGAAPPSTLSLSLPAELRGVARAGEALVAGVRLVATPAGSLARVGGASASVLTGDDGAYSLAVAGGISYELSFAPPPALRLARAWIDAEAPPPGGSGDLGAFELPPAIAVYGEVSALGGGALARAHVSLRCIDCPAERRDLPVAEATTDSTGRFRLMVPDPGVAGSD